MGSAKSIDVRIAKFLKRVFNYYIKKRIDIKPAPTEDEIWQFNFKENKSFIHELDENLRINLYKDSILCKLIYFGFEEDEISFIKRFLKRGDTFFDIGANIGFFSINASKIVGDTGNIYAFEPTPITYARLVENVKLNHFQNIKHINVGLSNQITLVDFNVSCDGHDAWNSLVKLDQLQNSTNIKINVETLDSFIEEQNISKVDLIKLDVEGWEKFVLEGGRKMLSEYKAPVCLVEFTEENAFAAGYYCGELFDYMKTFGYEWYSYNKETNQLHKVIKKLHYPYENLIAIKDYENCVKRLQ